MQPRRFENVPERTLTGNRKDRMTIEQAALATCGFVIFLILILMSNKQRF
jgi:hypothetical protein